MRSAAPDRDLEDLCPLLVGGLLSVLDDPAHGVDPGSTRHAHVVVERLGPLPPDADVKVTAHLTAVARLGGGDGLWIDVDVAGVARTQHVVSARVEPRPARRRSLPTMGRGADRATGRFIIDHEALSAYRAATSDTSLAHDPGAGVAIVPGLLVLTAALARLDPPGASRLVSARFASPLLGGAEAEVLTGPDGHGAVTSDGRTILRLRRT